MAFIYAIAESRREVLFIFVPERKRRYVVKGSMSKKGKSSV